MHRRLAVVVLLGTVLLPQQQTALAMAGSTLLNDIDLGKVLTWSCDFTELLEVAGPLVNVFKADGNNDYAVLLDTIMAGPLLDVLCSNSKVDGGPPTCFRDLIDAMKWETGPTLKTVPADVVAFVRALSQPEVGCLAADDDGDGDEGPGSCLKNDLKTVVDYCVSKDEGTFAGFEGGFKKKVKMCDDGWPVYRSVTVLF